MTAVLDTATFELSAIEAGYTDAPILRGVGVVVEAGTIVALCGANGAGKTTLLRVAAGLLRPTKGSVKAGGVDITRAKPNERSRVGVCLIPEGRGIFRGLTVRDNLALFVPPWLAGSMDLDRALTAFPILGKRLGQIAGSLSGGEQQMLSVSRAYVSGPKFVFADELSMGLSPIVVDQIYQSLVELNRQGVGLLIVEQHVQRALAMASRAYIMTRGRITYSGSPDTIDRSQLEASYLVGVDEE
jgi:branched-chain amino acid transport system ATP-binding protein